MKTDPILREIVRRIRKEVRPQKIILFGSRARGTPHRHSDYDILVVKRTRLSHYRRAEPIRSALVDLPVEVDVDVVMYTPFEIHDWSQVPQAFITTAMREGKVLYEEAK